MPVQSSFIDTFHDGPLNGPSNGPFTATFHTSSTHHKGSHSFNIKSVDHRLKLPIGGDELDVSDVGAPAVGPLVEPAIDHAAAADAPLGPLSSFKGTFQGVGFNTIFRPNSGPRAGTTFPNPVNPPPPTPPNNNVLELNLTTETLTFKQQLGQVPNRGLGAQGDIVLNGIPYEQTISDVTNLATGLSDGAPVNIHFENGLWMHVPASKTPSLPTSLCRMGSIPHGSTINAQSFEPTATIAGAPVIPPASITPFVVGQPSNLVTFPSTNASDSATARLPQDLSKFMATGAITQKTLSDPNSVLRNALLGTKIIDTTVFTVSTKATPPLQGGGTANIAFLDPNASVPQMSATFWIETVQHELVVPVWHPEQPDLKLAAPAPNSSAPAGPTFVVRPPFAITAPRKVIVTSTQIQYSQMVFLNFGGLTWPHVSVATLVPKDDQMVPESVFF